MAQLLVSSEGGLADDNSKGIADPFFTVDNIADTNECRAAYLK